MIDDEIEVLNELVEANAAEAEQLTAERDTLRAEVERMRGELASSAQTIADANRASDYALDVMRRLLGTRDCHGIEEGAEDVEKLVAKLRGEVASEKEKTSQAWREFRNLSVRAGENYHNLLMRFRSIEARAEAAEAHAVELRAAAEAAELEKEAGNG